jgi:hypothetical protein
VIHPHLPVRIPCYDFTPITNPTFDGCLQTEVGNRTSDVGFLVEIDSADFFLISDFLPLTSDLRSVSSPASGVADFRGVTGGVYKARERIHRDILIRDY